MIVKEPEGSLYRLSYLNNTLIIPGELVRRMGYRNRKGTAVGLVIECEMVKEKNGWRRVTVLWGPGER